MFPVFYISRAEDAIVFILREHGRTRFKGRNHLLVAVKLLMDNFLYRFYSSKQGLGFMSLWWEEFRVLREERLTSGRGSSS